MWIALECYSVLVIRIGPSRLSILHSTGWAILTLNFPCLSRSVWKIYWCTKSYLVTRASRLFPDIPPGLVPTCHWHTSSLWHAYLNIAWYNLQFWVVWKPLYSLLICSLYFLTFNAVFVQCGCWHTDWVLWYFFICHVN